MPAYLCMHKCIFLHGSDYVYVWLGVCVYILVETQDWHQVSWSLSTYLLRQGFWLAGSSVFGLVWLPSLF